MFAEERPRGRPPVISVITAVLPSAAEYLDETWASLRDQQLPDGWALQWCLQLDGPGALDCSLQDPRISVRRNDDRLGPALSRTLALGRATGSLVKVLDGDDQLTPGQLARDIGAFVAEPELAWVTSPARDLYPDGSLRDIAGPPAGPLAPGWVVARWRAGGYVPPVHPATLCMRFEAVAALGGWMALPASEDTALLLCLHALFPGAHLSEPGLLYRKWPRQLTATASHRDARALTERIAAIEARLAHLPWLGGGVSLSG